MKIQVLKIKHNYNRTGDVIKKRKDYEKFKNKTNNYRNNVIIN